VWLPNYNFGHILFVKPNENKGYRVRLINSLNAAATTAWIMTALTGCATVAPPATPQPKVTWETRKALLDRLDNWQISGKIAVTTAKDAGSASVDWSQHAQHYKISLYGPLGANAITLNGSPSNVVMITSDGKKITAPSAEQLIAQQWGWNLPVSYLKYWVRGLPAPSTTQNARFDAANHLVALSQQGYNIQFQSYTTSGAFDLPSRLSISSPALKSKIIIYKWSVG
jgi:outer membrane lipoprotein LolB